MEFSMKCSLNQWMFRLAAIPLTSSWSFHGKNHEQVLESSLKIAHVDYLRNWRSLKPRLQCTDLTDDLHDRWPTWSITYMTDDRWPMWPTKKEPLFTMHRLDRRPTWPADQWKCALLWQYSTQNPRAWFWITVRRKTMQVTDLADLTDEIQNE